MIRTARGSGLVGDGGRGGVGALGGSVGRGRDAGFEVREFPRRRGVEAGELGRDARLDVQFQVLGAGAVGFGTGLEGVDEVLGEADWGFARGEGDRLAVGDFASCRKELPWDSYREKTC